MLYCMSLSSLTDSLEPCEVVMNETALVATDLNTYQCSCRPSEMQTVMSHSLLVHKLFVFILKAALTHIFKITMDLIDVT